VILARHLETTERLLARAASKASGRREEAKIVLLPDLGLPHNVVRARGGFFTGAYYSWSSCSPIVPIDATVNVDTVSVFRVRPMESDTEFQNAVAAAEAIVRGGHGKSTSSSYSWNFAVGNHFVTYGISTGGEAVASGNYLVLHSSASEYKYQHNGLYPVEGNWYWPDIQGIEEPRSGRYLRFISGNVASRFYTLASALVEHNSIRHRYVAELVMGRGGILEEIVSVPHYGMPSSDSVAIGCQWISPGDVVPLLTGPARPILLIRAEESKDNVIMSDGRPLLVCPHGLGKQSKPELRLRWLPDGLEVNGRLRRPQESLENDRSLQLRDFFATHSSGGVPPQILHILELCPGKIVGRIDPVYSYARTPVPNQESPADADH
jgi:hypothetical protein